MPYCTQQDLNDRFGEREIIELTDRDGDGVIDPVIVSQALTDADDEINAYVAVRYTLPLSPVPSVLSRIAADIARFRLYDDNATDEVEARYKNAIYFLKSVSSGKVTLGPAEDGSTVQTDNVVKLESQGHVFKRDDSKGFI